jgi:preprotein translocase subunit SecG
MEDTVFLQRLLATLSGVFGVLALVLASRSTFSDRSARAERCRR